MEPVACADDHSSDPPTQKPCAVGRAQINGQPAALRSERAQFEVARGCGVVLDAHIAGTTASHNYRLLRITREPNLDPALGC